MVMEMDEDKDVPVILGRPFLRTARTIFDTYEGTLTMRIGNEKVQFQVANALKYPDTPDDCFRVDVIDELVDDVQTDLLSQAQSSLRYHLDFLSSLQDELSSLDFPLDDPPAAPEEAPAACRGSLRPRRDPPATRREGGGQVTGEAACAVETPAIPEVPADPTPPLAAESKPELKPLPANLRYEFLDPDMTSPVIVSTHLSPDELSRLLEKLRLHRGAIGYSIKDIKGLNPAICAHRIHLEEDHKPSVQHQRRLNPILQEVVKKEILKLLDANIIFPISDSKWVSPVHVVPKKSGATVVENEKGEKVQVRATTGWRMCIDYRKLNAATRKDHFPLPFVDQMLERLAMHSHFCFLDGYSGFFQEFDIEIKDKPGSENSVADHLSRLHWEGEPKIAIQLMIQSLGSNSTACLRPAGTPLRPRRSPMQPRRSTPLQPLLPAQMQHLPLEIYRHLGMQILLTFWLQVSTQLR